MNEWVTLFVHFDGEVIRPKDPYIDRMVDKDRTLDDRHWKNIVNQPDLVVVEWLGHQSAVYNRYIVHIKTSALIK